MHAYRPLLSCNNSPIVPVAGLPCLQNCLKQFSCIRGYVIRIRFNNGACVCPLLGSSHRYFNSVFQTTCQSTLSIFYCRTPDDAQSPKSQHSREFYNIFTHKYVSLVYVATICFLSDRKDLLAVCDRRTRKVIVEVSCAVCDRLAVEFDRKSRTSQTYCCLFLKYSSNSV
jgi:hypothetical protein